ncbi:SDR family oxidoreductase [Flavobacterium sp.]|uniref:SDR family oxidoreductase n=1 Tax=Flavobacterium sp. TaxID=239 RepID=UPI002B4B1224|nr:SDR family oxidoreductase [Flavobacterium sp.]HLF52637.1 SDR family oxidoreductase [Flavobacterium sp.]
MEKKIFITGTSSGFGKLMTKTLAAEGHTLIAGMRGTQDKNKAVAEELSLLANVEVVEIDVADDVSVGLAFEKTLAKYGAIDVLINNAGVTGYGLLESYSLDKIREMFEINFYGVLRTYQAVLPGMRMEKRGLVINITSGASGHTLPFMIPYFASKFGVESITEGLQEELKQFNIENVTIQPGVYPTEMTDGSKAGLSSDKPEITLQYGEKAAQDFNALGTGLYRKLTEFKMNPQTIAEGVLALINMPDGSRPLRYPLDAIAQGTDHEFINARAEIKSRWLDKYMS